MNIEVRKLSNFSGEEVLIVPSGIMDHYAGQRVAINSHKNTVVCI